MSYLNGLPTGFHFILIFKLKQKNNHTHRIISLLFKILNNKKKKKHNELFIIYQQWVNYVEVRATVQNTHNIHIY